MPTDAEILIQRYEQRLTMIYSIPNFYYKNPEQERKEIEQKIKEIKTKEKINSDIR